MQEILFENQPCMDKTKIQALKTGDEQLVAHVFEFGNGLNLSFTWPQGMCHKKGALERILEDWREHIGGDRTHRFLDMNEATANTIHLDWNKYGVHMLVP